MDGINHQAQDETQSRRIWRTNSMNFWQEAINSYDDHGMTPYHVAITHKHNQMAGLLKAWGANPDLFMLPCIVDGCNEQCKVKHDCKTVHPKS